MKMNDSEWLIIIAVKEQLLEYNNDSASPNYQIIICRQDLERNNQHIMNHFYCNSEPAL